MPSTSTTIPRVISRIVAALLDRRTIPEPLRLDRLLHPIRTRHIDAVGSQPRRRPRSGCRHVSAQLVGIDGVIGGELDVLHCVVGASARLAAAGQEVEGQGCEGAETVLGRVSDGRLYPYLFD